VRTCVSTTNLAVCTWDFSRRFNSRQFSIGAADRYRQTRRTDIGPVPTSKLNWLQPHDANIIDFFYRNRAYQVA
jgi:hypothetical protein